MDKIVSQYTRSPHQNEFYSEQEQQELTETLPPISLKFNLPPLDNVSWDYRVGMLWLFMVSACLWMWMGCGCGCLPLGHRWPGRLLFYPVIVIQKNIRPKLIIISRFSPLVSSVR